MKPIALRSWLSAGLVLIGLLQPLGFALGLPELRGLGAVSAASPLPFVFSSFRGFETFATEFEIELVRPSGDRVRFDLTPELYAKLDGPYNRRNTYGAVLAYGPALDKPDEQRLVRDVLGYGLCRGGPLARRFGEAEPLVGASIVVRVKTRGGPPPFRLELECPS